MPHRARTLSPFAVALFVANAVAQASWQLLYPTQSPPANYLWARAFDEARGEAIFAFPWFPAPNNNWRWNGVTWSQLAGPQPPSRYEPCMVFDAARQRVVLFGGTLPGTGQLLQDLWEWDGVIWQQRTAAMPPARRQAAMAYDRARSVTVLFGGSNGNLLDDTWEWNGTTWTNAATNVRPAPRQSAVMAFDPVNQRVLLYGGGTPNGPTADTWTWNGAVWQQHQPSTPPFLRQEWATAVADLARGRVVLLGGSDYDIQTWEWDGAQWHASIPGSPGAWNAPAAVYDTVRREVVLHGGENGLVSNQTWRYRTAMPANAVAFGAGCAGSAGVPVLATAPYTLPWLGDTVRTRVAVPPAQPGALFVSSFAQQLPPLDLGGVGMPGCSLLVPTDVVELVPAVGGSAQWSLMIPNVPALAGAVIHQQAFPFDPGANALGLAASNGLSLTTGIR